jgi:hypothetical protein
MDFSDLGGQAVKKSRFDFSDLGDSNGGNAPTAQPRNTFRGFAGNLLEDTARNSINPMTGTIPAAIQAGQMFAHPSQLKQVPGAIFEGLKSIPHDIKRAFTDPQYWYDRPVTAAMNAAIPLQMGAGLASKAAGALAGSEAMQGIGKRFMSAALGPETEAIQTRFSNPSAIENASSREELAARLPQHAAQLQEQISKGDTEAWKTLRTSYDPGEGAVSKEDVTAALKHALDDMKVYGGGYVGPAAKEAARKIQGILGDIGSVGKYVGGKLRSTMGAESSIPKNDYLPEQSIKGIIQSLDSNINWDIQEAQPVNQALESARGILDDILKNGNKSYAKAMEPVSEQTRLLHELKGRFNITSVPGRGLQPGTQTEGALANVLNKNKSVTRSTLENLKKWTGADYLSDVQNSRYAEQFQPGATRPAGSRRVNAAAVVGGTLGSVVGGWPGSAIGGALGTGLGLYLDREGGAIAGKIIDAFRRMQPAQAAASPALAKYGSILENAVQRGVPMVVANNELARDPGYRELLAAFSSKNIFAPPVSGNNSEGPSMFRKVANRVLHLDGPPLPAGGTTVLFPRRPQEPDELFKHKQSAKVIGPKGRVQYTETGAVRG